MSIDNYIRQSVDKLNKSGIGTARLDCLVLLEDITRKDRSWLLAHPEFELTKSQSAKLDKLIDRRAHHEPLAYVRGKTEFYGREFIINNRVLEPRPESETMINLLKPLVTGRSYHIEQRELVVVDVGAGSGALAISAKLELPKANIIGVDIDKNCLKIARKNAKKLGVEVSFLPSNLLSFLQDEVSWPKNMILLCNLPYVPDNYKINLAAMNEPQLAIFGGKDGLDIYRKMFRQIDQLNQKPQHIFTESLPPQHKQLIQITENHGYQLTKTDDFIQLFSLA